MAVPFALGRVIDLIYSTDSEVMKGNLHTFCAILLGVFIVGGLCNFGRVYLMNMSGILNSNYAYLYAEIIEVFA